VSHSAERQQTPQPAAVGGLAVLVYNQVTSALTPTLPNKKEKNAWAMRTVALLPN